MFNQSSYFLTLKLFICWVIITSISACGSEKEDVPNVDHIKVAVNFHRFEQDLFALDSNNISKGLESLKEKYPAFYALYFQNVLNLGVDSSQFEKALIGFLYNPNVRHLKDTATILLGDLSSFRKDFGRAMQFTKYYFPDYQIPDIYTFISEFNYQRFIFNDGGKDGLGLGLDLFLGENYPYKSIDPTNPSFSNYLTRTFNTSHMAAKAVDLIIDDLAGPANGSRLLDQMIYNGKKLYFKKKFMPEIPDSIIFEYSDAQMNWVKENELEMWSFFTDKNLMFETNFAKINKYINPSPDSPGMPKEAPGKTGNYIGYKIIKAYMKKFPATTLKELSTLNDAQKFLEHSKYKPERK